MLLLCNGEKTKRQLFIKLNNAMTRDVFSAPKFFKIIEDPPPHHNLRIPGEFMKRHGRNLSNRAFLKVPNRDVSWEVELIHCNGETVMQKGWKEFSELYSLGFAHFLLFEYAGNSLFNVLIFDRTASEIDYPSEISDFEVGEPSGTMLDDSVVVLEHLSSKKRKPEIVQDSDVRVVQSRMKLEESSSGHRVQRKQTAVVKETSVAYQKALDFAGGPTFRDPFFISLMHPTHVAAKYGLDIPLSFAKGNLPYGSSTVNLRIKNVKKKVWPVTLCCNCCTKRAKLSFGWKNFVKDNSLKVGDVCIFVVGNDFHWNVVIFKS